MFIEINDLSLIYETRRIDPNRSLWRHLLSSQYELHPVLKGLNLRIEESGVTALLGRNGAGKTTLVKVLTGILAPSHGFARVLGFDPTQRRKAYLRQIGAVFGQKRMLWPELSLLENWELSGAIYALDKKLCSQRSQELLQLFNLAALADRPAKTYSLGESVKAEIATALLHDPKILFLDEPTIGLDVASQQTLRGAIVRYVAERHCHVLLTSHNLRDVAVLAKRILLLEDGKITDVDFKSEGSQERENALEAMMLK